MPKDNQQRGECKPFIRDLLNKINTPSVTIKELKQLLHDAKELILLKNLGLDLYATIDKLSSCNELPYQSLPLYKEIINYVLDINTQLPPITLLAAYADLEASLSLLKYKTITGFFPNDLIKIIEETDPDICPLSKGIPSFPCPQESSQRKTIKTPANTFMSISIFDYIAQYYRQSIIHLFINALDASCQNMTRDKMCMMLDILNIYNFVSNSNKTIPIDIQQSTDNYQIYSPLIQHDKSVIQLLTSENQCKFSNNQKEKNFYNLIIALNNIKEYPVIILQDKTLFEDIKHKITRHKQYLSSIQKTLNAINTKLKTIQASDLYKAFSQDNKHKNYKKYEIAEFQERNKAFLKNVRNVFQDNKELETIILVFCVEFENIYFPTSTMSHFTHIDQEIKQSLLTKITPLRMFLKTDLITADNSVENREEIKRRIGICILLDYFIEEIASYATEKEKEIIIDNMIPEIQKIVRDNIQNASVKKKAENTRWNLLEVIKFDKFKNFFSPAKDQPDASSKVGLRQQAPPEKTSSIITRQLSFPADTLNNHYSLGTQAQELKTLIHPAKSESNLLSCSIPPQSEKQSNNDFSNLFRFNKLDRQVPQYSSQVTLLPSPDTPQWPQQSTYKINHILASPSNFDDPHTPTKQIASRQRKKSSSASDLYKAASVDVAKENKTIPHVSSTPTIYSRQNIHSSNLTRYSSINSSTSKTSSSSSLYFSPTIEAYKYDLKELPNFPSSSQTQSPQSSVSSLSPSPQLPSSSPSPSLQHPESLAPSKVSQSNYPNLFKKRKKPVTEAPDQTKLHNSNNTFSFPP